MLNQQLTSEYKSRLKEYYKKCIISEGSKIITFSLIFSLLSLFQEYIFTLLMLLILRTNGGGLHCKKYQSCFFLSFFMILGNIVLAKFFRPTLEIFLTVILFCLPIMVLLVPVTATCRPTPSVRVIKKSKIVTFVFIIVYTICSCTIAPNILRNIGFWTIIMHTGQLILAHKINTRR